VVLREEGRREYRETEKRRRKHKKGGIAPSNFGVAGGSCTLTNKDEGRTWSESADEQGKVNTEKTNRRGWVAIAVIFPFPYFISILRQEGRTKGAAGKRKGQKREGGKKQKRRKRTEKGECLHRTFRPPHCFGSVFPTLWEVKEKRR